MNRIAFVSAAVIAAAVYQMQAASARDAAGRRQAPQMSSSCIRAPAEGAYAGAPYKEPPCMPKTSAER
jgi:hypothetical protein